MTEKILNIRKIVEDEMRRITREIAHADGAEIAERCLICGQSIPTTEPYYTTPKVCDKCKAAVLKVRKEIEGLKEEPTIDPESLKPHWLGEKGISRDDPPGPDIFEKTYERGKRMFNTAVSNKFSYNINAVSGTLRKSHPKSKMCVRPIRDTIYEEEIVILQVMLTGDNTALVEYVLKSDFEDGDSA